MTILLRTGLFVGIVAVTAACCLIFTNTKTDPATGVVVWLPDDLAGYDITTGTMGEEEKKWLPSDTTFLKRVYKEQFLSETEAEFRAINATLIVAGSDSRSLHRPRVCLTAQHWTIEKEEVVRIETRGGPLEVMDYHLVRALANEDGTPRLDEAGKPVKLRAHYVYWWIGPDASTASDEERVLLEMWNSIRKGRRERWAYPSVMTFVDERSGSEEARGRAYQFISKFAPDFQKSLGAENREGAKALQKLGGE